MSASPITIYHNPRCSTSRKALELIRAAGHEPQVVEYLQAGWTRPELERLLAAMNARPRDLLRRKEKLAAELGLLDESAGDDRIIEAMLAHPVLVERPIVVTPAGAKVGRPVESLLDLFDRNSAS